MFFASRPLRSLRYVTSTPQSRHVIVTYRYRHLPPSVPRPRPSNDRPMYAVIQNSPRKAGSTVDRRSKCHRGANTGTRSMLGTDSRQAFGRRCTLLFIHPGVIARSGERLWRSTAANPQINAPRTKTYSKHTSLEMRSCFDRRHVARKNSLVAATVVVMAAAAVVAATTTAAICRRHASKEALIRHRTGSKALFEAAERGSFGNGASTT